MDAKVQWKVNAEVESLVDAIAKCKQELVTAAFSRHGMKTKLLSCDAYAGSKLLQLLELSEVWTPASETDVEDDSVKYEWRKQHKSTHLVADFTLFRLHRMDVLGEDAIRVLTRFQVEDSAAIQEWIGNVEIVK